MQILILKPSSLGDIICSLPVAQSIREQMPDAVISWVVKTRFRDIVERCPTVNGEIIEFNHCGGLRGLGRLMQTVKSLKGRRFDAVLDFQGLMRSGMMTWAVDSPLKVGSAAAREGSRLAYNSIVPLPADGTNSHAIDRLLQFLPALGLEPQLRSPVVIRGESPETVDPRLKNAAPVVMIPNSRGVHKEWTGFPELTRQLLQACPDVKVAWDSHLQWQNPNTPHADRFINLTSKTSLLQMVELLRCARLVIANDSGPLHIAAALGVPTLGLFGPTSPRRFGPFPPTAEQNNVLASPTEEMSGLAVDEVLAKTISILQKQRLSAAA